jgi:hypothetical protein
MATKRLALLTLAVLAGCGGDHGSSIAADSLSRDLQRLPVDSSAALNDQSAPVAAKPAAAPTPVAAKPKATPKPKAKPAPAPAPAPLALDAGATVSLAVDREITSRTDKAGAVVTATVSSDVQDSQGRVVIPAGSKVTMTITQIHESENKGDKTGKLVLTPTKLVIAGHSYPISGSAMALDRTLKDRKTNAGDLAKVGVGVGAGALLGTAVSGGSTKGAVIGGVVGGAVGTQRAIQTQDRDVVVPAGSRLKVTLGSSFRRSI